jgi:hypothetical protein
VTVTDNGPGIAPELAQEVFRRGYTTKDSPGHGLGLALVAQIVKRCNGEVDVSAAEGGGAVFEVMIPRQAAIAVAARSARMGMATLGSAPIEPANQPTTVSATTVSAMMRPAGGNGSTTAGTPRRSDR